MLTLNLRRGEYFTIGEDIVVQALPDDGAVRIRVDAPRDVAIVRGTVRERAGMEKPEPVQHVLLPKKRQHNRDNPKQKERTAQYFKKTEYWKGRKDDARDAIEGIEAILDRMGESPESAEIKRQLARILPVTEY